MKQQLNISVFGLKITTIDELKRMIESFLPQTCKINWCNISDAHLDVLLISHLFYDLPNIVAIRQNSSLKTLKIAHDPHLQRQVVNDTLYLPAEASALQQWFGSNVLDDIQSSSTQLPTLTQLQQVQAVAVKQSLEAETVKEQTISAQDRAQQLLERVSQQRSTIDNEVIKPIRTRQQPLLPSGQANEPVEAQSIQPLATTIFTHKLQAKNFENLQQQLWQSEEYRQCIITTANDKIALIDKPNHQFWLSRSLDTVQNQYIQLKHADLNDVVRFCHKNQAYDLNFGLWNFVWHNVGSSIPRYTGCYRLKYWPQPLQQDRKDIFKIASYLQYGADLDYVHQQTQISLDIIHRFVFASLVSNMIQSIDVKQADPRFTGEQQTAVVEQPSALRNFFGKLRKKLGL